MIFAVSGRIAGFTWLPFQKQQLADPLASVDAAVRSGTVAELQRQVTFPTGFGRGGVQDDSHACIRTLAETDHGDVTRHFEIFQSNSQAVGMGRQDEIITVLVVVELGGLQIGRIEPLGIHHRTRHMAEHQEFLRGKTQVIPEGGAAKAEHGLLPAPLQLAHQTGLEGVDHAEAGLIPDPGVVLQHGERGGKRMRQASTAAPLPWRGASPYRITSYPHIRGTWLVGSGQLRDPPEE